MNCSDSNDGIWEGMTMAQAHQRTRKSVRRGLLALGAFAMSLTVNLRWLRPLTLCQPLSMAPTLKRSLVVCRSPFLKRGRGSSRRMKLEGFPSAVRCA